MRAIVFLLVIANLSMMGLGLSGAFDAPEQRQRSFDPEVPGYRGRLLELADDVVVHDPFPLLPATGQCFVARGFDTPDDAQMTARRWLSLERAVTPMRRAATGPVTGFQIFTPPLPLRDDRVRLQQELEQLGYPARLVAGGPYADRVSLGLFEDAGEAAVLQERLQSAGFETELVEMRDQSFDIIVAGPIEDRPPQAALGGLTVEPQPCATVAAAYARF